MKIRILAIVAGLWLMAGCGGGGGGGSQGPVYNGVATPAVVTSSNAKALSVDAYSGAQMSAAVAGTAKLAGSSDGQGLLTSAAFALTDSVTNAVAASRPLAKTVAATAAVQNTIPGYSGSLSYNISADTVTGAFSGTITFSQFREMATSPLIDGSIDFSGVYNQSTSTFSSMTINIKSITATSGSRSFTLSGSESSSISGTTQTLTLSVLLTDNQTGRTYWAKDYVITLTGSTSLTVSGTYYDPIHGSVVISTTATLTVSAPDAMPTAGQLLFTGANGTMARLTFNSTGYIVEVYTGSGSFTVVP